MAVSLTPERRKQYQTLWDTCVPTAAKASAIGTRVKMLLAGKEKYQAVAADLGCDWALVAVIHSLEADCNFTRHLHNGDPLTARTVRVPAGQPKAGNPPFTWPVSAIDALRGKQFHQWKDWSAPGVLFKLEGYNGFGYLNKGIFTPYLWSFSNHYVKGKFTSDGVYDPNAKSAQIGAAILLNRLAAMGEFTPKAVPAALPAELAGVRFDPGHDLPSARALQTWLNTQPGIAVVVDGRAGKNTSDAIQRVTGRRLPGDPRGP